MGKHDTLPTSAGDNPHPLDPLTAAEVTAAVAAIRAYASTPQAAVGGKPIEKLMFNSVTLRYPAKYSVLKWNGLVNPKELEEVAKGPIADITRQADADIICPLTGQSFGAVVDLPSNISGSTTIVEPKVTSWTQLEVDIQPSLQAEELLWAEEVCKRDPMVKKACDAIGIKQENIAVDGWCIGHDDRFPGRRLQQCFMFARLRPGDNLYAHPCDFVAVMDSHSGEVLTIDYPHLNPKDGEPPAPSSEKAHTALASRDRYPPPLEAANYLPEQIAVDEPNFKVRTDLKPLHVEQPEGVSFALDGRVLSWQKWKLHVGYSYREGLVLSNITYHDDANGERPLFYRLSVAEMVVPYGKPTFPHHRKHAFDTGEYGIGALANSLELGCDCLGSISYLDAHFVTRKGGIETIKSAICIHEEDAGILHKHTDFRDLRAHVARNRKLYGFYFNFGLDGSVELEVKATGIINVYALAPGEPRDTAHEVEVSPRVVAHHHQHLFSFRVDPMLDGLKNRVVEVDVVPDEGDVGSESNYYGNGFSTVKRVFTTAKTSVSDYDASKTRTWVMENPNKKHRSTGGNIGYKLVCKDMPPLLAKEGSLVWNRAPFARHNMFVTPHSDDELYPAGLYINQHPGGKDFGIQAWVNRDEPIENKDVVLWPCFGVTHISRPEDWPIMPVEILRAHLKPSGFFDRNPGLDVPASCDSKSRLASEATGGGQGENGTSAANGSCCAH